MCHVTERGGVWLLKASKNQGLVERKILLISGQAGNWRGGKRVDSCPKRLINSTDIQWARASNKLREGLHEKQHSQLWQPPWSLGVLPASSCLAQLIFGFKAGLFLFLRPVLKNWQLMSWSLQVGQGWALWVHAWGPLRGDGHGVLVLVFISGRPWRTVAAWGMCPGRAYLHQIWGVLWAAG